MEAFLDTLGAVALIALVVVGLAAGAIAGAVAGRNRLLYLILGLWAPLRYPLSLPRLASRWWRRGLAFAAGRGGDWRGTGAGLGGGTSTVAWPL